MARFPYRQGAAGAVEQPPGPLTFPRAPGCPLIPFRPTTFPTYEMLDALVQEQPADALEPEIGGQFAAIGIVKGKKFAPDARMSKILTDAIAIANGAARTVAFTPREIGRLRLLRPTSKWLNSAVRRRLRFQRPTARGHQGGREAFPLYGRAYARCPRGVLLCGDRRHPGHEHAPAQCRLAISVRVSSTPTTSRSTAARPTR